MDTDTRTLRRRLDTLDEERLLEAQRPRVMAAMHKWWPILGLTPRWHMILAVVPKISDGPGRNGPYTDGLVMSEPIACTESDFDYMTATITFSASVCELVDDMTIERNVLHEIGHILLTEMRPDREQTRDERRREEHSATVLACVFQSLERGWEARTALAVDAAVKRTRKEYSRKQPG
jgi:hypothetical protein